MLLPDFPIVPRFPGKRQPGDNSTLSLLQCTNRLKSCRGSVLAASGSRGLLAPGRPGDPATARCQEAYSCSRRSLQYGQTSASSAGEQPAEHNLRAVEGAGGGWPRTQSPAPLGDPSNLWNGKTVPDTLQRMEMHAAEAV